MIPFAVLAQGDYAKDKKPINLGLFGGGNYVINNSSIPIFADDPDLVSFSDGTSIGFFIGIDATYEVWNKMIFANARLMYDSRPASLSQNTSYFEVLDPDTDEYVPFVRDHTFESSLSYLNFEIAAKVFPLPDIPVYARVALDIGSPIFKADFTQTEEIVSPLSVQYPEGGHKKTVGEGEIQDASTSIGASLGIGAKIPTPYGFFINPEVSYRMGLNSQLSNSDWKSDIVRAGIGINWDLDMFSKSDPPPIKEEIKEEPVIEKPIEEKPDPKKNEILRNFETIPLRIDETVVTQTYPLLPYIFFDSTSSDLARKYTDSLVFENKSNFDEQLLPKETMGIYYNIFDIIAYRLKKYTDTKITITGTGDGEELDDEEARLKLARKRAETVRDYFTDEWDIDEDRIAINYQNKPKLPTSNEYYEGYEENRRAEITSDDPRILRPVIHSRFMENAINKDKVEFLLSSNPVQIKQWNIALKSKEGIVLENIYGEDQLPDGLVKMNIDWKLFDDIIANTEGNDSLMAEIQVVQHGGDVETKRSFLHVNRNTAQFEIGRLNLIVFDFDRSQISQQNKDMIENFIETSIQDNSKTKIIGSTDRLGEKNYNIRLSQDRANSVLKYLNDLNPNVTVEEVKGIGDKNPKYDNNTPEGRFYCRTVLIEVKTPFVKGKK
jgi:outer membrane protein OmpA-like peptidoglycan-associated protein